jgi:hypothetical protein
VINRSSKQITHKATRVAQWKIRSKASVISLHKTFCCKLLPPNAVDRFPACRSRDLATENKTANFDRSATSRYWFPGRLPALGCGLLLTPSRKPVTGDCNCK